MINVNTFIKNRDFNTAISCYYRPSWNHIDIYT